MPKYIIDDVETMYENIQRVKNNLPPEKPAKKTIVTLPPHLQPINRVANLNSLPIPTGKITTPEKMKEGEIGQIIDPRDGPSNYKGHIIIKSFNCILFLTKPNWTWNWKYGFGETPPPYFDVKLYLPGTILAIESN